MSSLLFIILCFCSMHANSDARYIGLGRSSNMGFRTVFSPLNEGQSTKGSVLVEQDDDLAAELKGTDGGTVVSSPTTSKGMKDYSRTSTTTKADVKPHVTASWSVPQQNKNPDKKTNHGGKTSSNPGIYSDYSRPRTRPPSHN